MDIAQPSAAQPQATPDKGGAQPMAVDTPEGMASSLLGPQGQPMAPARPGVYARSVHAAEQAALLIPRLPGGQRCGSHLSTMPIQDPVDTLEGTIPAGGPQGQPMAPARPGVYARSVHAAEQAALLPPRLPGGQRCAFLRQDASQTCLHYRVPVSTGQHHPRIMCQAVEQCKSFLWLLPVLCTMSTKPRMQQVSSCMLDYCFLSDNGSEHGLLRLQGAQGSRAGIGRNGRP